MFNCITGQVPSKVEANIIPHFIPKEYIGRSVSVIQLRMRIKPEHNCDLTYIDDLHGLEELRTQFVNKFGPGAPLGIEDPMLFLNWAAYNQLPKHVGFFSVVDLLHSDFLIVEALSLAKESLNTTNLRTFSIGSLEQQHPGKPEEIIDFSVDSAMFHIGNAVQRLRACFDKLVNLLGFSLHANKALRDLTSYEKKVRAVANSDYVLALPSSEQRDSLFEIIDLIEDISTLKSLRDRESHTGIVSVRNGVVGYTADKTIMDVISLTFEFLARFRIAFLKSLIFLPSLKEGGPYPQRSALIVGERGFYIFDRVKNKNYMTFVRNKSNMLHSEPVGVSCRNGEHSVKCKDGTVVKIDFKADRAFREDSSTQWIYRGNIAERNMYKGWEKVS